jgi:hypothetical protein
MRDGICEENSLLQNTVYLFAVFTAFTMILGIVLMIFGAVNIYPHLPS